jgi:hypothetical protein
MSQIITALDFDKHEDGKPYAQVDLLVIFRKREWGGWYVTRADNGRHLGWLCLDRETGLWEARMSESAYRGTGTDDQGDILDTVPAYLTHSNSDGTVRPCGCGSTRMEAAEELLSRLLRHHASAVGYGAHYDVKRWADR